MTNLSIAPVMKPDAKLTTMQLRHQLGEVLERVYYRFDQFHITRKDKPMARLVNERYMQAIDDLIQSNPALADTLALMLNDEFLAILEQGQQDIQAGNLIPIGEALR